MAHVRLLGGSAPAAVVDVVDGVGSDVVVVDVVDGVGSDVVVVALPASEPGVIIVTRAAARAIVTTAPAFLKSGLRRLLIARDNRTITVVP
jgi:MinD-like ATPase involved in chromosome partitioning or flagellar assembly